MISLANGQWYYDLFYQLAVIVSFVIYAGIGLKRHYPMHQWLLIYLSGLLFLTAGAYLITFDLNEWSDLFTSESMPLVSGKSSLGAIIGLTIGILIAQKLTKSENLPALDAAAFAVPVAFSVQRLGCLSAGCCFGLPYSGPLSISYGPGHVAYRYHLIHDHIEAGANSTPDLYPIPLLLAIGGLLVAGSMVIVSRKLRAINSLFILSMLGLLSLRFVTEFFRDPLSNHQLGETLLGMKLVQWLILTLMIIFAVLLLSNERVRPRRQTEHAIPLKGSITLVLLLILSGITISPLLSRVEILNLIIQFGLVVVVFALKFSRFSFRLRPVWSFSLLILFSLLWMGQTRPDTSFDLISANKSMTSEIKIIQRHSIGGAFGAVDGRYEFEGCDGNIHYDDYTTNHMVGYEYERIKIIPEKKDPHIIVGGHLGSVTIHDTYNPEDERSGAMFLAGGKYGSSGGFTLGIWAGNMYGYTLGKLETNGGDRLKNFSTPLMIFARFKFGDPYGSHMTFSVADDAKYGMYRYLAKAEYTQVLGRKQSMPHSFGIGLTDRAELMTRAHIYISPHLSVSPSACFWKHPTFAIEVTYHPKTKLKK